MKQKDQIYLASNFMDAMKAHVLRVIAHAPESWDGFEIRKMIALEFEFEASRFDQLPTIRRRQFRSQCVAAVAAAGREG